MKSWMRLLPTPRRSYPETLTPLAVTPVTQVTPRLVQVTPAITGTTAPAAPTQAVDWLPLAGMGLGAAVCLGLGILLLTALRKRK